MIIGAAKKFLIFGLKRTIYNKHSGEEKMIQTVSSPMLRLGKRYWRSVINWRNNDGHHKIQTLVWLNFYGMISTEMLNTNFPLTIRHVEGFTWKSELYHSSDNQKIYWSYTATDGWLTALVHFCKVNWSVKMF